MAKTDWNSMLYDQKHAFVFEYGKSLLSLLDPQSGEVILDLGCGTGHLTKSIAESGARVIGTDSSASMIESARETYPDIEFLVADARTYTAPETFDAIFSNATLHWIPEAEQVVQCIATSLKPGGRLVLEMGGKGNIAHIQQACERYLRVLAPDSKLFDWYFPSIGQYTPLLERYGLEVQSALLFDRPTKLEDGEQGLRNWMQMFYASVVSNLPDEAKQQLLSGMEKDLRAVLFKDGSWVADYRRLRIVAYKT
jgi:trans-aconitate methyltransferase